MHLLVVDPNVPFATLLAEELGRLGHEVTLCADGGAALQSAQSAPPDVAFLDMALAGPDARTLAHQLRALDPGMRLVLIPLMGDGPQLDDMDLPIQGILPKPFFLPDLPDHIEAALRAPLPAGVSRDHPMDGAPAIAGPEAGEVAGLEVAAHGVPDWVESLFARTASTVELAPDEESLPYEDVGHGTGAGRDEDAQETGREPAAGVSAQTGDQPDEDGALPTGEPKQRLSRRAFRTNQARVEALMRDLAADVEADGVLLTSDLGLLAAVGLLEPAEAEAVSRAVLHGWETSAEVARILGREQVRFEQSITGGDYMLYALSVHDAILAVTVRGSATLGLLRHRARVAAERIAELCAG